MIREEFRVHSLAAGKRRRVRRAPAPTFSSVRVLPAVWRCALVLADGDPRRIEVRSATEVVVRNQRGGPSFVSSNVLSV